MAGGSSGNSGKMVPQSDSLGALVRRLSETWTETFHSEIDRHHVTPGQWRFLRELWREDGITQSELSERVGRRGPTTGAAIKLLVRSEFVRIEKSRHDRRKSKVHLTERGRAMEAELAPLVTDFELLATADLTDDEVRLFWRLLERVQATVDGLGGRRWADSRNKPARRRRVASSAA